MTDNALKLINQILELDTKNIWALHTSTGKVLRMFGKANEEFVAREIQLSGSVADFYDFTEFDSSKDMQILRQIKQFTNQQFVIHSRFPFSAWKTIRLSETEFFGRIAFLDMAPNVIVPGYSATILVDNKNDTIFGIRVHSREGDKKKEEYSEKLIGRPVSEILSPTPNDFAKKNISRFSWDDKSLFKTVYKRNFTESIDEAREEISEKSSFHQIEEGLLIDNQIKDSVFISPRIQLDTRNDDFIFKVRCRDITGEGPYLTFGEKYLNDLHFPDDLGYMAGLAHTGTKVIFKKHGYITTGADLEEKKKEEYTISLVRTGKTLRIYIDEKEILVFFDNDFSFDLKGFVSIGLRKGRKSIIKSAELLVKKNNYSLLDSISQKHIVTLKNDTTRYYNLERFFTTWLSNPDLSHVAGYYLSDITELQMKTVTLDKEYQAQVKRGKELSELLKQYQKEEELFTVFDEKMEKFKDSARIAAESEATILIEGETGTGKEVLANYIHKSSRREANAFVKVDCATIPATLIEDHLFGHEKGAFTGATQKTLGMFEKADKGTLFLDEISNLPLDTQTKLLQFFNDFTIIRIGGTQPIKLNVRCIVASNERLETLVKKGKFREDLYYRLNVLRLFLPPLRNRKEDISGLAMKFLKSFCEEADKKIKTISPDAMKKLQGYNYPGNIRELKNIIRHAVIFGSGDTITPDLISFSSIEEAGMVKQDRELVKQFRLSKTSTEFICSLLERNSGNVMRAARELGVSKISLYAFINKRKIDINKFRLGYEHEGFSTITNR